MNKNQFDITKLEYLLDKSKIVCELLKARRQHEGDMCVISSKELEDKGIYSNGNCIRCFFNFDLQEKGNGMATPPYELNANCAYIIIKNGAKENTIRHELIHCLDFFRYDERSAIDYGTNDPKDKPIDIVNKGENNRDVKFPDFLSDENIKNKIIKLVYGLDLLERYAILANILGSNSYKDCQRYKKTDEAITDLEQSYLNANKPTTKDDIKTDFASALMYTILSNCTNEDTYFLPQFFPEKYRGNPECIFDMTEEEYKSTLDEVHEYFSSTWCEIKNYCANAVKANVQARTSF